MKLIIYLQKKLEGMRKNHPMMAFRHEVKIVPLKSPEGFQGIEFPKRLDYQTVSHIFV